MKAEDIIRVNELSSLWQFVCSENKRERHLVSDSQWSMWEDMRRRYQKRLDDAKKDHGELSPEYLAVLEDFNDRVNGARREVMEK